jgi:hypothetical protein
LVHKQSTTAEIQASLQVLAILSSPPEKDNHESREDLVRGIAELAEGDLYCDTLRTANMSQIEMVVEELKQLPADKLERAAAYVHQLHEAQREARRQAVEETAGCMTPAEADEFLKRIEEGCEQLEHEAGRVLD